MALVLSRRVGEKLCIGDNVTVLVRKINGNRVTLALDAPKDTRILREELRDKEADKDSLIDLRGKVKFQSCIVAHSGTRLTATDFLVSHLCRAAKVVGCSLKGGDRSTLTGGDRSTLTGGDGSTLTGGYRSTLTGGDGSTLTGGDRSTLSFKFYDGSYFRLVTIYVGESGIEPKRKYRLNDERKPELVG